MCLLKIHQRPKITLFPRTVYKVLIRQDGNLLTPYARTLVEIGEIYTGKFNGYRDIYDTEDEDVVEDGFIHSYISLKEAKEEERSWRNSHFNALIVKCRIPMFTFYYKGTNKEIASRKLKYIKIID